MKKVVILLILLFLLPGAALAAVPQYSYTYPADGGYRLVAPASWLPERVIRPDPDDPGPLLLPKDLFVAPDGCFYIADTGNSRILKYNAQWEFEKEYKEFYNAQRFTQESLAAPEGVFVDEHGRLYIADTGNGRIVVLEHSGELKSIWSKPLSDLLDSSLEYRPVRIAIDDNGRAYIIARNINNGILEYDLDGQFKTFIGATLVNADAATLLWRFFQTKEQIARGQQFVPTEYSNLCLDAEGFIYSTVSATIGEDNENKVRRINPSGVDVLRRKGFFPQIGRLDEESRFVDVAVRDHGIYSVLDETNGEVFTYDADGFLLYVFGKKGQSEGTVRSADSLVWSDGKLYVLDGQSGIIQQFAPTEYGAAIDLATSLQAVGQYDQAAEVWSRVLKMDQNSQLAWVGIGKYQLSVKDYENALQSFKNGGNRELYSKAKQYLNKAWTDQYFSLIAIGVILLISALIVYLYRQSLSQLLHRLKRPRGGTGQ